MGRSPMSAYLAQRARRSAQGVTSAPALTTLAAFAHLLRFGAFAHTSYSTRGNPSEQAEPRLRAWKTGITKKVTGAAQPIAVMHLAGL